MECKYCKIYDPDALKLLNGLSIFEMMNITFLQEPILATDDNTVVSSLKNLTISDSLACSCCRKSFQDISEQRSHYKLDWHRYNLKRALKNNEPVTEEDFLLIQDKISSVDPMISNSSSSSVSGSGTDLSLNESNESTIIKEKKSNEKSQFKTLEFKCIKAYFENENNQLFCVYKCLLQSKSAFSIGENLIGATINLITTPQNWMILLLGGGHFAAAIFNKGIITCHKTFHCYTVRANQGGSQSKKDKKGGSHPKSAGASLRRYNEQALVDHVQEILYEWSANIKECNLILYRASGPWNKNILFSGKKAPFCKTDKRLRNISFPTRRATLKEVKRIHDILSTIEIYGCIDEIKKKFHKSSNTTLRASKCDIKAENVKKKKKLKNQGRKKIPKSKIQSKNSLKEEKKEIIEKLFEISSEDDYEVNLTWDDVIIDFSDLQEYDGFMPVNATEIKNDKLNYKRPLQKKKKKSQADNNQSKLKEKASVPMPLPIEEETKLAEKKNLKQLSGKVNTQIVKDQHLEDELRTKFLTLSDSEKCALAAERHLIASATSTESTKPNLLFRCFECGFDLTGKIPFHYGNYRFCCMSCLKAHRAKTNSYGHNI